MSDDARRGEAVDAYIRSLRTGTPSSSQRVEPYLADDAVFVAGPLEVRGRAGVLARVTGQWPLTPVYEKGAWSTPEAVEATLVVRGSFPGLGAAPSGVTLTFSFNDDHQIQSIVQETVGATPSVVSTIPPEVRGLVNSALANSTPMTVGYTDETGAPVLSLRGSVFVYGDTQLALWVRNAEGGMVRSLKANPMIALLYRDSRNRTTLIFQGRASIASDAATRDEIFEATPEVEQNHVPTRTGAAVIVNLDRMQAMTPFGIFRYERQG